MCGIIAYKGEKKASEILFEGLKNLEYRGYDSAGMITLENKNFDLRKDKGKVDEVNRKLNFLGMNGNFGMAHTRWSTHGVPSKINCHPHLSNDGNIAVVHNGIIENYQILRTELEREGYYFVSGTDSEVIPILVEKFMKEYNFKDSVFKTLKMLEGTFAVIFINKFSNELIASRKSISLIFGIGDKEFFLSSNFNSFIKYTKKVLFLEDEDVIIINNNYEIFNLYNNNLVCRKVEELNVNFEYSESNKDFMLKEIYEQPSVLKNMIKERIIDGNVFFDELDRDYLKNIRRIVIFACGTSYYAGLIGKFIIEYFSRIPVEVDYASEFRYRDPLVDGSTLAIAISQSGETADTIGAVREAKIKGAKVLSICNTFGSSIARESNFVLYTKAGTEIGVASTKTFISQLGLIYLFGIYLAQFFKNFSDKDLKEKVEDFKKIPDKIEIILEKENDIKKISDLYYNKNNILYLGKGINYPVALEGALKLKEVSYIHAEGYPSAEMKHGPIALIDENMPVFFIAVEKNNYSKIKNNVQEIKSRGGIIISLLNEDDKEIINLSREVIFIPKTSDLLYPFLTVVPLQLLAYYIGKKKGYDVDKPRSLAKSVTVE